MPIAIVVLTCITLILGASEVTTAQPDGVPGRRIGGGTRYEVPTLYRVSDV